MIQLKTPNIDSYKLLDDIIDKKKQSHRKKLLLYKERVKERYRYYELHVKSLSQITSLEMCVPVKDELHSCYGSNVGFSEAKKKLIASLPIAIQSKCPYCMLNRPNTLDHYFDKNDYPEYSVFIPNLIPCCSECNNLKSNKVFSDLGRREFIHFYYDTLPDYKFLFIRFTNEYDQVPKIEVFLQFQENDPLKDLVTSHFSNLYLINKYKESINDKLSVILSEINCYLAKEKTKTDIEEILQIRYTSMIERNGYNYWEACIFEGILNSPNYLRSIMLIYL